MLASPAMRMPGVALPLVAALLLGALFAGESVWVALGVVLATGAWVALALLGRVALPRGGVVLLGSLLGIAVWTGLSVTWSVAPDRSLAELDRTLVYLGFLVAGLLLGAGGPAARRAVTVLAAVLGAAILWSLAGKVIPALFPDGGRAARLRDPIGYWNALALAADMLLVLALSLAAATRAQFARAGWAVLAFAAVVAIFLAASRAGVAAALLGVMLLLALRRRDRIETALLALLAAVPGGVVAAWAFTRPALVENASPHADRVADGAVLGLVLAAGAVVVAVGARALARRPLGQQARRTVARALVALAVVGALGLTAGLAANAGRIADEFRGGEVTNDPRRFSSLSSNNRLTWWGEAWDVFAARPLEGAGAGTFEVARKRHRENAAAVTEPHSVPLQFLAGTGILGAGLLVALLAAVAAAAARALRVLTGDEREAAAALTLVPALWLAHALVDYDWDFAAVTGPALLAAGVLAAVARPARMVRMPLAAAGVAALALAAAASIATPWLAGGAVREVNRALEQGDVEAARDAAERARALDPLGLDPVFARARVEEQAGDEEAALAAYRRAAELQPENPVSWYELGLYEFSRGDRCAAYVHLNRAYTLDPAGTQWTPESALVESLAWVNGGNCG